MACDPDGPPLARVFKTMTDPYVGRLSLCRLLSGTLSSDVILTNTRSHSDERLHTIETLRGKEAVPLPEVVAGDLFAVPKLSEAATGDTLAPRHMPVSVLEPLFPEPDPPALSIAIHPRTKADEDKMMSSLHRLLQEDPALSVRRDDETHQTILEGAGETHVAVPWSAWHESSAWTWSARTSWSPTARPSPERSRPRAATRSRPAGTDSSGWCHSESTRLPRGEGFAFADEVVGGAIPRQYIPAVEKGVLEAMAQGGVFGYPVVDVAVTCRRRQTPRGRLLGDELQDGGHPGLPGGPGRGRHRCSSSRSPGSRSPCPPSFRATCSVTSTPAGAACRAPDVDARRPPDLVALVPTAELARYAVDLRSLTGGRGRFRRRARPLRRGPPS